MHPFLTPVEEPDVHFAKIVLREFSGQPLEPHERADGRRSHGANQIVERRLAAVVPRDLRSSQELHREYVWFARQQLRDQGTKGLRLRRSAHPPSFALPRDVKMS